MIIERQLVEKIEITGEEVDKIFRAKLDEICQHYFVRDGKLMEVINGDWHCDVLPTQYEVRGRYDLVVAACRLRDELENLKAAAVVDGLARR